MSNNRREEKYIGTSKGIVSRTVLLNTEKPYNLQVEVEKLYNLHLLDRDLESKTESADP